MKKFFIAISTLIALAILLFFFFYPNLNISNPNAYHVKIDGKSIGNGKKIRKTIWGEHYLSYGAADENGKIVNGTLELNELILKKPKQPKITKTDLIKLTPGFESPTIKGNDILYLGGRRLDSILSFNLNSEEFSEASKTDLRGANKLIWNQNKDKVLIYIDETAVVFSDAFQPHINMWLYEIPQNKLTPLEFSEATFKGSEVIGLNNGELKRFNNGKYFNILNNNTKLFTRIRSSQNSLLAWNQEEAVLVSKEKTKTLKIKGVHDAALSETGKIAIVYTEKDKTKIRIIDANNKVTVWPMEANTVMWVGEILFAGAKDAVWKIDISKKEAFKFFENKELPIGTFFSDDKGNIFLTNAAYLQRISF